MINKKVLVIGGAGFIGSNLCEELVKYNDVVCLDNYLSGSTNNHVDGVKYFSGEARLVTKLITDRDFNYIFHFGEYSRVEQSVSEFDFVLDNNLTSILPVLKFATSCYHAKLIYSGSSTKFGDNGDNILASPYAFTKNVNSQLVAYYCSQRGIQHAICYFYNVYGRNEIASGKYATVVAKFKRLYLDNKALTVVHPGTQKRNFTHIDDVINGLLLIAENGQGDGYGIGSDEEITISELASLFNTKTRYLPEREGNRMGASLVNQKTKGLGWIALNSIREHIREFIDGR